jgi:hypothetical protein
MKGSRNYYFLFALTIAASAAAAQSLDWQAVERLAPNTRILVKTQKERYCYFQKATSDKLFCDFDRKPASSQELDSDLVFKRD